MTLGVASGRLIQVIGNIKKGELIIVRGNERVRPNQELVISEVLEPRAAPRSIVKENIGN